MFPLKCQMVARIVIVRIWVLLWAECPAFCQSSWVSGGRILVLDDCDEDFRKPPFEDAVLLFGGDGRVLGRMASFNICATVGGSRALAVGPGATSFVVCENVAHKITSFDMK